MELYEARSKMAGRGRLMRAWEEHGPPPEYSSSRVTHLRARTAAMSRELRSAHPAVYKISQLAAVHSVRLKNVRLKILVLKPVLFM